MRLKYTHFTTKSHNSYIYLSAQMTASAGMRRAVLELNLSSGQLEAEAEAEAEESHRVLEADMELLLVSLYCCLGLAGLLANLALIAVILGKIHECPPADLPLVRGQPASALAFLQLSEVILYASSHDG